MTGLLIDTEVAPRAIHLSTSVPRRNPESTMISVFGYYYLTALAIAGKTLIVAGAVSGLK